MTLAGYFDNAATTPIDPRVLEAMLPFLGEAFGNGNSIHAWGLRAHDAAEAAREKLAIAIGAEDPSQIYFTSGATESNNWVLNAARHVVVSPFEHSAMREPAARRDAAVLGNRGVELERRELPRGQHAAHGPATLVSVMAVNNEIGAVWDAAEYAMPGELVHSDITQAVGKYPLKLERLDFASLSAHKFYGPKGIGALYCKDQPPEPLILGGEQEQGARGGTLNVAAIVGMGKAAEIAAEEQGQDYERAKSLRAIVLDGLANVPDWRVNPEVFGVRYSVFGGGNEAARNDSPHEPRITNHASPLSPPSRSSPFILSLSFRGLEGETLVLELDRAGYAVSAGAACSSRSTEPSHVLRALNLEPEWLRGTVRLSFGRFNTEDEAANLAKKMRETAQMLRTL